MALVYSNRWPKAFDDRGRGKGQRLLTCITSISIIEMPLDLDGRNSEYRVTLEEREYPKLITAIIHVFHYD